ncbi:MAG: tail fiber protein [Janthinobacterium sp.]
MKSRPYRVARRMTLAAVAAAAASWSTASYACPAEPYVSSICVMAWTRNDLYGYMPANGQSLNVNQNAVLYSLLGTTYGGTGNTTFNLPDLRGRTVIGAGTFDANTSYTVGQKVGAVSATLSMANLPAHTHTLPAVDLSKVSGSVNLAQTTGTPTTISMTPVTYSANTSALTLTLKASSAAGASATPLAGSVLGAANGPAPKLYNNIAPDVVMGGGSLGGSISVTATGSPTIALAGTAPVTLSGSLPATVSGITGTGTAFSIMQPSMAMYYYIAAVGIYPQSN